MTHALSHQALINNFPRLKIFNPSIREKEKEDLINRIYTFSQTLHENWDLSTADESLLKALCLSNFEIFSSDALFLYEYGRGAEFWADFLETNQANSQKVIFWRLVARKVSEVFHQKACFPLFQLPSDILSYILQFNSLPEISKLMIASCCQPIHLDKSSLKYVNQIKWLLSHFPILIIQAPNTSLNLKTRVCRQLCREWGESDEKTKNLFITLYRQADSSLFKSTLINTLATPSQLAVLLQCIHPSSQTLSLDFRFLSTSDYSEPHLLNWLKVYESSITQLGLKFSTLDLAFNASLTSISQLLSFIVSPIFILNEIETLNLTMEFSSFFDIDLECMKKLISQMKSVKQLKITVIESKQFKNINQNIFEVVNTPVHISNFLNLFSGICLDLRTIEVTIDYQIEARQIITQLLGGTESFYNILYYNRFSFAFSNFLSLTHLETLRLIIPKLYQNIPISLNVQDEHFNNEILSLSALKEIEEKGDYVAFTLRKNPSVLSSE